MRILPDTNVVIWWLEESPRLGEKARDAITEQPDVVVSAVSAFEIAAKAAIGRLREPGDLAEQIADQRMTELPLTVRHGLAAGQLPMHHRDPFDRLLIAQARCEGSRSSPPIGHSPPMTCRSCRPGHSRSAGWVAYMTFIPA